MNMWNIFWKHFLLLFSKRAATWRGEPLHCSKECESKQVAMKGSLILDIFFWEALRSDKRSGKFIVDGIDWKLVLLRSFRYFELFQNSLSKREKMRHWIVIKSYISRKLSRPLNVCAAKKLHSIDERKFERINSIEFHIHSFYTFHFWCANDRRNQWILFFSFKHPFNSHLTPLRSHRSNEIYFSCSTYMNLQSTTITHSYTCLRKCKKNCWLTTNSMENNVHDLTWLR